MTHSHANEAAIIHKVATSKPSVIHLAKSVLLDDLRIDGEGNYFLFTRGRFVQAKLPEVMKAANTVLAREGRPQISHNPAWVVPVPPLSTTTKESAHV